MMVLALDLLLLRGCKSLRAILVVALTFLMMSPTGIALKCPTSCSNISPLPYPFGAIPGCGSPGFVMSNCSMEPPQWNFTVAGNVHSYYIQSINPSSDYRNLKTGSNPNFGYGGTVLLYLNPTTVLPSFCQILKDNLNNFTTSNLYAFAYANLSYYEDSYIFFNCSLQNGIEPPESGFWNLSSPACNKYVSYCKFSTTGFCFEYVPDKELQLAMLMTTYGCSTMRRFVIADTNEPISSWKSVTQLAWGPVRDAVVCSACQETGGTCGYNTQDTSFLCYCNDDKAYTSHCNEGKSGKSKAIGIGISLAVLLLSMIAGMTFYYRYKCYCCGVFASQGGLNLDGVNQAPLEISYWTLSAATKNFSTKIGQGAFGKVYRGVLYDGTEVAVKVLDSSLSHTDEQFLNEVATIGNIHHVNVARLIGFCFRKLKRILVYEYVSNGSLDKYLFVKKQELDVPVLSWKQRFNIAVGIARGLAYMHEECRSCIIHCDIKPQNILLDAAFCPKIADFGLARLLKREESRVLTHAKGTPGYVAPEFWSFGSGPLSAKFDVYSYGMVLLEIIRGRRSFEEYSPFSQEEDTEMDSFVSVSVDERIEHDVDMEQVDMCTRVALWCIQEDPSVRPTMSRVVQFLQGTATVPADPPKPFRTVFHSDDSSLRNFSSSEGLLSPPLLRYDPGKTWEQASSKLSAPVIAE